MPPVGLFQQRSIGRSAWSRIHGRTALETPSTTRRVRGSSHARHDDSLYKSLCQFLLQQYVSYQCPEVSCWEPKRCQPLWYQEWIGHMQLPIKFLAVQSIYAFICFVQLPQWFNWLCEDFTQSANSLHSIPDAITCPSSCVCRNNFHPLKSTCICQSFILHLRPTGWSNILFYIYTNGWEVECEILTAEKKDGFR